MKAHINGITVEGTPEEIIKYQKLIANKSKGDSPLDIKDILEDVIRQTKKKPVIFGYPDYDYENKIKSTIVDKNKRFV